MALRQSFTAQNEIPDVLREHYTEKDGRWILQTDPPSDDVTGIKSALDKERQLRRDAEGQLTTMKTRFEGIEPEAVQEMRSRLESFKDKEVYDKDGLEALVARRTEQMKAEHTRVDATKDREISTLTERAAMLDRKWRQDKIRTALLDAATKAGVAKHAIEDAVQRGMARFVDLDDQERVIAKQGEDVVYGKDGVNPLTPDEWIVTLKPDAPHLWPPSAGGGASPNHNGAGGGVDYSKITSPTERLTAFRQAQRSRG